MKKATLLLVAALVPAPAGAQLYKCKQPDGKVVYSDARCEGSDKGALKVNPNSTTLSEREKAAAEEKAEGDKLRRQLEAAGLRAAPAGDSPSTKPSGPHELTYGEKERIRNLETTISRQGTSREARAAAQMEINEIRSGRDAEYTSDQRPRRDSLKADFVSADPSKRRQALDDFQRTFR